MSAALALAPAIDWCTVAPEDWQYIADLLPTGRPALRLVPAPRPAPCVCFHCKPTRGPGPDPDLIDDEPRIAFEKMIEFGQVTARVRARLDEGFGQRSQASRYLELRALDRLRELGDVDKLEPCHRDTLGLQPTAYERPSRARFEPKAEAPRVRAPLTADEQADVLEHLNGRPIRETLLKFVGTRQDWLHGVWLELVNPPADVERPASLWVRVDRAVGRFEKSQKKQMWAISLPRTVLTREVSRHAHC
ncbi:MAG: hypothetical protein ACLP1X_04285 [Polyangiaceae bacterium]